MWHPILLFSIKASTEMYGDARIIIFSVTPNKTLIISSCSGCLWMGWFTTFYSHFRKQMSFNVLFSYGERTFQAVLVPLFLLFITNAATSHIKLTHEQRKMGERTYSHYSFTIQCRFSALFNHVIDFMTMKNSSSERNRGRVDISVRHIGFHEWSLTTDTTNRACDAYYQKIVCLRINNLLQGLSLSFTHFLCGSLDRIFAKRPRFS